MHKTVFIPALLGLTLAVTACDKSTPAPTPTSAVTTVTESAPVVASAPTTHNPASALEGSGIAATKTVALNGVTITSVVADSSAVFTYDPSLGDKVVISADDNLQNDINITTEKGVLRVDPKADTVKRKLPIQISWGGAAPSTVELSGASNIILHKMTGNSLTARVSGSGNIIADGQVQSLSVVLAGSGNFDGRLLASRQADARISGSGNVIVQASEQVGGDISGSGNVQIWGNPPVRQLKVTGSGNITYLR